MKKTLLIIGGVIALAVVGLVAWILMLPESGVKMANEMDSYALEHLEKHQVLNRTERLIAYYDATLSMTGEESAIVTNERVLYHKQGRTTAIPLTEVADVQHHYESMIGDVFMVQGKAGDSIKIEIPPYNGGETFKTALMNAWRAAALTATPGSSEP